METICPDFKEEIAYLDLDAIESSNDTTYVIDTGFVVRAFNSAYVRFGQENDCPDVEEKFGIGFDLREAITGPAKDYYEKKYQEAIDKNKPLSFEYECSSPEEYRLLYQSAYPILNGKGLLISNHVNLCCEHKSEPFELGDAHKTAEGFIVQCSHCRKIQNQHGENQWDWIPSLVSNPYHDTSHTFCQNCLDHYYPDI